MKGGMGSSIPFCSEFWSIVVLAVKGVVIDEMSVFTFLIEMFAVVFCFEVSPNKKP